MEHCIECNPLIWICDNLAKALSLLPEAEKLTICPDGLFGEKNRIITVLTVLNYYFLPWNLWHSANCHLTNIFDEECCKALAGSFENERLAFCNITEKNIFIISQMKKIKVVILAKITLIMRCKKPCGMEKETVTNWF